MRRNSGLQPDKDFSYINNGKSPACFNKTIFFQPCLLMMVAVFHCIISANTAVVYDSQPGKLTFQHSERLLIGVG
jgi:hypothetical protein